MMLVEVTQVPQAALPVHELKEHLRLGTGFADDDLQDSLLESQLRAAMATIEARTGKILIARDFRWTLNDWRNQAAQVLPISPVQSVTEVALIDGSGAETVLDPQSWYLETDFQRPALTSRGPWLPDVPQGGAVRLSLTAGYGAAWADLPRDLAQAVILLAAHFHENRFAAQTQAGMPEIVRALIEGYRSLRLFMGGAHG